MAWVYPVSASNIQEWYVDPPHFSHAAALALGDTEYIYTPAGIHANSIMLDMSHACGVCELRARRGTGSFNTASLVVTFYDSAYTSSEQWTINLASYPNWTDFSYTPSISWQYVELEAASIDVLVGVSMLRGQSLAGIPRRLLTGVGL